jgi:VanZ family protein
MQPQTKYSSLQRWLLLALLGYLAFVIYGSLVPWQFRPLPLNIALEQFSNIRYLQLGISSRADWVANILLFIPFAFLLAACFLPSRSNKPTVLSALFLWLICLALALAIEFTQLYFPQRTVSINDIIAESFGALLGIMLFYLFGQRILHYLHTVALMQGSQRSLLKYLLMAYIALFTLYNILPLDLTLSPIELYKKWRESRIILLPFSAYHGAFIEVFYAIFSDVLLWCPIAILLYLQQHSRASIYIKLIALACLIEFFQLFVYSRVTDLTDVILAFFAAWLSCNFVSLLQYYQLIKLPSDNAEYSLSNRNKLSLWLAFSIAAYSLIILLVFWYPYNFDFDWAQINQKLMHSRNQVLLESLYFGTEYRAITALLQKVLLFAPLGALWAFSYNAVQQPWQKRLLLTVTGCYTILLAFITEAMQLALPGKTVDLTDVLLAIMGAASGFLLTRYCYRFWFNALPEHLRTVPTTAAELTVKSESTVAAMQTVPLTTKKPAETIAVISTTKSHPPLNWLLFAHLALSLLALYYLSTLSAVPYNVRELLTDNSSAILGIVLMCYLLFTPSAFTFPLFAQFILYSPIICLLQSSIIFGILYFTVPTESLYDILGSPILALPPFLELLLRFIGFFSLIQFNCLAANQFIHCKQKISAAILWLGGNFGFAAFWYWAVVFLAATDNIIELLADGGSVSSLFALTLWLILVFSSAAAVANLAYQSVFSRLSLRTKSFVWLFIGLALTLPLSWWLINIATESVIVKYQQVYSALQFLLSTDRSQYADPLQLLKRYSLAYMAMLSILSWFYFAASAISTRVYRLASSV